LPSPVLRRRAGLLFSYFMLLMVWKIVVIIM
jgi:hypothetical protein